VAENEEFTRFVVRTEVLSKAVKKNSYSCVQTKVWNYLTENGEALPVRKQYQKSKIWVIIGDRETLIFFSGAVQCLIAFL
jgi:hypothetical protein